jgi:hypothetical protein
MHTNLSVPIASTSNSLGDIVMTMDIDLVLRLLELHPSDARVFAREITSLKTKSVLAHSTTPVPAYVSTFCLYSFVGNRRFVTISSSGFAFSNNFCLLFALLMTLVLDALQK